MPDFDDNSNPESWSAPSYTAIQQQRVQQAQQPAAFDASGQPQQSPQPQQAPQSRAAITAGVQTANYDANQQYEQDRAGYEAVQRAREGYFKQRGLDTERDGAGRAYIPDTPKNRALGVTGAALGDNGQADDNDIAQADAQAAKVALAKPPELDEANKQHADALAQQSSASANWNQFVQDQQQQNGIDIKKNPKTGAYEASGGIMNNLATEKSLDALQQSGQALPTGTTRMTPADRAAAQAHADYAQQTLKQLRQNMDAADSQVATADATRAKLLDAYYGKGTAVAGAGVTSTGTSPASFDGTSPQPGKPVPIGQGNTPLDQLWNRAQAVDKAQETVQARQQIVANQGKQLADEIQRRDADPNGGALDDGLFNKMSADPAIRQASKVAAFQQGTPHFSSDPYVKAPDGSVLVNPTLLQPSQLRDPDKDGPLMAKGAGDAVAMAVRNGDLTPAQGAAYTKQLGAVQLQADEQLRSQVYQSKPFVDWLANNYPGMVQSNGASLAQPTNAEDTQTFNKNLANYADEFIRSTPTLGESAMAATRGVIQGGINAAASTLKAFGAQANSFDKAFGTERPVEQDPFYKAGAKLDSASGSLDDIRQKGGNLVYAAKMVGTIGASLAAAYGGGLAARGGVAAVGAGLTDAGELTAAKAFLKQGPKIAAVVQNMAGGGVMAAQGAMSEYNNARQKFESDAVASYKDENGKEPIGDDLTKIKTQAQNAAYPVMAINMAAGTAAMSLTPFSKYAATMEGMAGAPPLLAKVFGGLIRAGQAGLAMGANQAAINATAKVYYDQNRNIMDGVVDASKGQLTPALIIEAFTHVIGAINLHTTENAQREALGQLGAKQSKAYDGFVGAMTSDVAQAVKPLMPRDQDSNITGLDIRRTNAEAALAAEEAKPSPDRWKAVQLRNEVIAAHTAQLNGFYDGLNDLHGAMQAGKQIGAIPDRQSPPDAKVQLHPDTDRDAATALARVGQGTPLEELTSAQQAALKVIGKDIGADPVDVVNNTPIVTERAKDWLEGKAPAAAKLIDYDETAKRQELNKDAVVGEAGGEAAKPEAKPAEEVPPEPTAPVVTGDIGLPPMDEELAKRFGVAPDEKAGDAGADEAKPNAAVAEGGDRTPAGSGGDSPAATNPAVADPFHPAYIPPEKLAGTSDDRGVSGKVEGTARVAGESSIAAPVSTSEKPTEVVTPSKPGVVKNVAGVVRQVSKVAGVKQGTPEAKLVESVFRMLRKASPEGFGDLKVVNVPDKQWGKDGKLSSAPSSVMAYDTHSNTLYLRQGKLTPANVASAIVHEAGHFAEKFYLGEHFTQGEWEKLTDEQRLKAWKDYAGKNYSGGDVGDLKTNPRARSEWVAMQFARIMRGESYELSLPMSDKLKAFVKQLRELVEKWLGDPSLSTKALDAKIAQMMQEHAGEEVVPGKEPVVKDSLSTEKPVPKPAISPEHIAMRYAEATLGAIKGVVADKNAAAMMQVLTTGKYSTLLDPANKVSRMIFEELTGLKLPKTLSGTEAMFTGKPFATAAPISGSAERPITPQTPVSAEGVAKPESSLRRGKVGDQFAAGQVVTTASGRQTTPFPKVNVSTPRTASNTVKAVDAWLHANAVAEAKARGDEFNLRSFENENPAKMPPATKDGMEEYLFGDNQPPVLRPLLKPLTAPPPAPPAKPAGPKISEATKKAIDEAFDGLLGAPPEDDKQLGIEPSRIGAFIKAAQFMISDGVKTPEGMAAIINDRLPLAGRKYAQALWDAMGMVDPALRGTHDWNKIFEQPTNAGGENNATQKGKEPKSNQPEHSGTPPRPAVRPDNGEPREGSGEQAGGGNRPEPSEKNEAKAGGVRLKPRKPNKTEPQNSEALAIAREVQKRLLLAIKNDSEPLTRRDLSEIAAGTTIPAKQVDEAAELAIVRVARDIAASDLTPPEKFDKLVKLYEKQPNLTSKTSTSKINQAYSTPAPMAYLASQLADIAGGKSVVEPTAGNGMLLIEAKPENTQVNEIDPVRKANLESQGYDVSTHDASSDEYGRGLEVADRLTTNPPFGAVKEDGVSKKFPLYIAGEPQMQTSSIDKSIVMNTLRALHPNGKASLIIGSGAGKTTDPEERKKAYISGVNQQFFYYLYKHFNVTDHFTVDGDLYAKQGAGWPVDMITIDGRGQSALPFPWMSPPRVLSTWDELRNKLTNHDRGADTGLAEHSTPVSPEPHLSGPTGDAGGTAPGVRGESGRSGRGDVADTGGRGEADTSLNAGEKPGLRGDETAEPAGIVKGSTPPAEQGGFAGSSLSSSEEGSETSVNPIPPEVNASGLQAKYVSRSAAPPATPQLTPVNLVTPTARALQVLESRHGNLDDFVNKELGYASREELYKHYTGGQIDAIALAIDNVKRGGALINGDQTGMGKGRTVAAMIRWGVRQGLTPIFITKNPGLYADMLRDLTDIGSGNIKPFMTNVGEKIRLEDKDGNVVKEISSAGPKELQAQIEEATKTGKLPGAAKVIFTTYDQIKSDFAKGFKEKPNEAFSRKRRREPKPDGRRMNFLRAMVAKNLVIMDEAHLAGGESDTGWRVTQMISGLDREWKPLSDAAKPNGVYYTSATYAKRPQNMGVYFQTNVKKAVGDPKSLAKMMENGGVPLQQALSSMLAQDGQYIRREMDFTGIDFNYISTAQNPDGSVNKEVADREKKLADSYTEPLREIIGFNGDVLQMVEHLNAALTAEGIKTEEGGVLADQLRGTDFSTQLHNMVKQYVFAIKADGVANRAIEHLQQGRSPVIACENTMQSVLQDLSASGYPKNFDGLLLRYLDKATEITLKSPNGDKRVVRIDLDNIEKSFPQIQKFPHSAKLLAAQLSKERKVILDLIHETDRSDIPASPIDYIRDKITKAGFNFGEISGRPEYMKDGKVMKRNPADTTKAGQNKILGKFNRDPRMALLLTVSGSTGISAHASSKFRNQQQRAMIVAQILSNIDDMMQMFGRIFRLGQVSNPIYDMVNSTIPAELRMAAIFSLKMQSLNANTTSKGDGVTSGAAGGIDFLNKYGDEVIYDYLAEHPEVVAQLRETFDDGALPPKEDLEGDESGWYGTGGFARSVSGETAVQSYDDQHNFYDEVLQNYAAKIKFLDEVGENDLIAQNLKLDAETIEKRQIFKGDGDSVFDGPANLETVKVTSSRKPLPPQELPDIAESNAAMVAQDSEQHDGNYQRALEAGLAEIDKRYEGKDTHSEIRNSFRSRMLAASNEIESAFNLFNKPVLYTGPNGTAVGYVTNIVYNPDKPLTPSAQSVVVHLNTEQQKITLPMSQMDRIAQFTGRDWMSNYTNLANLSAVRRIVTGNLIGGYDAIQKLGEGGRVINYTNKDGQVLTGIMMPNSFNPERAIQNITSGAALIKVLRQGTGITSAGGAELNWVRGEIEVRVPASKSGGGRYWQDNRLLRLIHSAEMNQVGNQMVGRVSESNAEALVGFFNKDIKDQLAFFQAPEPPSSQPGGALGSPPDDDQMPFRGKPRPVEGEPGMFHRSHTDTLEADGRRFTTEAQTYERVTMAHAADAAKNLINAVGLDHAVQMALEDGDDASRPEWLRSAVLGEAEKQIADKQAAATTPEEKERWRRAGESIEMAYGEKGTESGQFIAMMGRKDLFSPDGAVRNYQKSIRTAQEKGMGGPKGLAPEVKTLLRQVRRVAANTAASMKQAQLDSIMNASMRMTNTLWQRYRDGAAAKLAAMVSAKASTKELPPDLQIFTDMLAREMRAKMGEALPKGEQPGGRSDIAVIADALRNREKYAEVWEKTKAALEEKLADQPELLSKVESTMANLVDMPYSKQTLTRAVREAWGDLGTTIRDVAKSYYKNADVLKRTLAQRLADEAGLPPVQAAELAHALSAEIDRQMADQKAKLLEQMAKKGKPAAKAATALDKLITAANLGAFDTPEAYDAVADKLGLPKYNPTVAAQIRDLAQQWQDAPPGLKQDRLATDLLTALAKGRGFGWGDVAQEFFYANILSGWTTQGAIAKSSSLNTLGDVAALSLDIRHPEYIPHAIQGLVDGFFRLGLPGAGKVLKSGYAGKTFGHQAHSPQSLLEWANMRELPGMNNKAGDALNKAASLAKYVRRWMVALHSTLMYQSGREAFMRIAAAKIVGAEPGLSTAERNQRIRDLLHINPADFTAARAQAEREGFTGQDLGLRTGEIIDEKRRAAMGEALVTRGHQFAAEATMTEPPKGLLGFVSKMLSIAGRKVPPFKLVVPFAQIPFNIANATLNYTPMGFARGRFGWVEGNPFDKQPLHFEKVDPTERKMLYVKAAIGSLLLAAGLAYATMRRRGDKGQHDYDVTGTGPLDLKKMEQMKDEGWSPHSVKVGNEYLSYEETPIAYPMGIIGNYLDAVRYNHANEKDMAGRMWTAMSTSTSTLTDMTVLSSLHDFLDALHSGEDRPDALKNWMERNATGAVVPNILNQIDKTINPQVYNKDTALGGIGSGIPGVRETGSKLTSTLGQPVSAPPSQRFASTTGHDPVTNYLLNQGLFVPELGKTGRINGTPMTDAQYKFVHDVAGQAIHARINAELPRLQAMKPEDAQVQINQMARDEHDKAKALVAGSAVGASFDAD